MNSGLYSRTRAVWLYSLCLALWPSASTADNPYANNRSVADEGAVLYASAGCIPCHGPNAEGAIGPNLVDDKWMKRFSEEMVFRTIQNGRRGTRMVGFKERLSEDDTWKVVEFLLAKGRELKAQE